MNTNDKEIQYDSPEDITSVDLTIQTVSGNTNPVIYANGRNQLPVEVIAKAMKLDPDTHQNIVLKFSQETWLHILNLRYASSDEKLPREGATGWSYTPTKNEYAREVITDGSLTGVRYLESGDELMIFYVYTDDTSVERIAVSIDTDGGKHFTTADSAAGAEQSSVSVKAAAPISYSNAQNLKIIQDDWVTKVNSLRYKAQEYGILWNFEHNNGLIRRRQFTIVTANGYSIAHKEIPDGLPETSWQKIFYHQNSMPHAFSLATQTNGCYLNSWFVVSGDGERGYAGKINFGYDNIVTTPYFPDLYFLLNPTGEFTAGTWAYWPYTESDDHDCWEEVTDKPDNISVVCFQLCIPDGSPFYWGEKCRPDYTSDPAAPITITDIYGNTGTFKITFNSSVTGDISVSP